MKPFNRVFLLCGVCLLGSGLAWPQAPPGPMTPPPNDSASAAAPPPAAPSKPEAKPRKNLLGAWKFNKDESDDGRARLRQQREADNTNSGNGGNTGGPRMGGWPGGPMGGGPGYGGQRRQPLGSDDESDRMGDVVNPPREIN